MHRPCVVLCLLLLSGSCDGNATGGSDIDGSTQDVPQDTNGDSFINGDSGTCGNSVCDSAEGETCNNCEQDCGACPASCGNTTCDTGETCNNCPGDCGQCCGNGNCDNGETYGTCPADCPCTGSCTGKRCGDDDGCGNKCFQGSDCRTGACGCGQASEWGNASNRWVCNANSPSNERCQLNCPYGNIGCYSSWYFNNTAYESTSSDNACKTECPGRCSVGADMCCLCDRGETCAASCN